MTRIEATFQKLQGEGKKALIPFITAGDPDPTLTVPLMHALVEAGANIVELGVPFSDPMADGPTIQRSSERALKFGTSLRDVMTMVAEFRKSDSVTPVVLMGYANPIEHMGYAVFAAAAEQSGVDGMLTVDYPPEEVSGFAQHLSRHGIAPIFLLAPTTPASRVEQVAKLARGFIYYVSLKGVTGAAHLDLAEVARNISSIKAHCSLPVGVGFGIRDAATAKAIAAFSDAVVIGSRIVQEIENSPRELLLSNVAEFVKSIRVAIDEN
jgi:tryptophan synthase alpha chain